LSALLTSERARMRAFVYLRAVLPLLETVLQRRSDLAKSLVHGMNGSVRFEVRDTDIASRLVFSENTLRVSFGRGDHATLRFVFPTLEAMNDFFAGKPRLPRIYPFFGLTHPILMFRAFRLLLALRILEPPRPGTLIPSEERALRVELLLRLVTRALERLHREGFEPLRDLASDSPDRVYQWTVTGTNIATWLRMQDGRVKSGSGIYSRRKPFVHFVFPDVDAAFGVLTSTGSQMSGFRGGRVVTYGSPEYTRKMALLMQKVDELLLEG